MTYEHILYAVENGVATLTINRPQVLNAVDAQTLAELAHAADRARDEGEARALVITGAGRAFSSGADLSPGPGANDPLAPVLPDMGAGLERSFNPLIQRLAQLPFPYLAAINGPCAGGSMGFALAADIVVAARSAYFLQPFVNIGLVPDVGATWLLPRLVGRARASAMMMLGERLSAEQAEQWGLIHRVVDDAALAETVRDLAERLARGPTVALSLMRRALLESGSQTLSESLALERENQRVAGRTADHAEGVRAFLEKRKPAFRGA